MTGDMTFEEKTTYGQAIITLCSYLIYLGLVLSRARDVPLAGVQYVPVLLWTAGAAAGASILNCILVACIWPRECGKKDIRDRQIGRFGEYVGQSLLCVGGLAALILSMLEVDHFWIANAIYLSFTLSGLLGAVAKIVSYRGAFPCE
jgi:hypothetical protein